MPLAPLAIFFVSGFCALVDEVVWARMLTPVLGNTTAAMTAILAAFMAGMALGGWYWGRRIDQRAGRPLLVLAGLEAGIGLYGFIFPLLLGPAGAADVWIYGQAAGAPVVRFLVCLAVLLVPTFLMGGTLAVLGRYYSPDRTDFNRVAALLYGINTAGAVTGTLAAGFIMIEALGRLGTLYTAAGLNLVIAAAAYALGRASTPVQPVTTKIAATNGAPVRPVWPALLALALSGFCALAYEVVWARLLVLRVDNSVYSFSIMLAAVLAGIALGSLLLSGAARRIRKPAPALAVVLAFVSTAAFIFPFFLDVSPSDPGTPYWLFLLQGLPWPMFAAAIGLGMTLPLCAAICRRAGWGEGRSLGWSLAVNTVGGVLGAGAAGFFLIPDLGFHRAHFVLAAVNLSAAVVALAAVRPKVALSGAVAGVLVLAGAWGLMPNDYFRQIYARLDPGAELVYQNAGRAASVSIFDRPDGARVLFLNGIPELDSSPLSAATFGLMGSLPALLSGNNQDKALMVTFGAGITSGAAAVFADRVDAVDLVDQYRDIAGYFRTLNRDVVDNPKFHMHVDDARHFLRVTNDRYQAIVSDATHPRSYDSWVLFTDDFYKLVQTRLGDGGMFLQWLPFHGLSPDQYASILKTFVDNFPHTSIWAVGGAYSLLAATPERLSLDMNGLQTRLAEAKTREALAALGPVNAITLLDFFVMGEDGVKRFLNETGSGAELITDNSPAHLFFSYRATLEEQYARWPEQNFRSLMQYRESPAGYLVNVGRSDGERNRILDLIRRRASQR